MIDNRFMIFMCTTYNLASTIVGHCQSFYDFHVYNI